MTVADNGTVTASGTLTVPGLTTTGTVTHGNTPTITSIPYFYAYGNGTQSWSGSSAYATLALSGVAVCGVVMTTGRGQLGRNVAEQDGRVPPCSTPACCWWRMRPH